MAMAMSVDIPIVLDCINADHYVNLFRIGFFKNYWVYSQ